MKKLAVAATALVSLLHVWFFVLETFLWQTAFGLEALAMTAEQASATAVLASNQGVYNAVLAAGLAWGLAARDAALGRAVTRFFLAAVVVVGVYGAVSAAPMILLLQATPALLALGLTEWVARSTPAPAEARRAS